MTDDFTKANIETLEKQAELGDVEAQYKLGMIYLRGEGTRRHDVNAFKWLRLAALNGNKAAIHPLTMIYLRDLRGFQSEEEYELFKRLAEKGDAQAQYHFATYCITDADGDNYLNQAIYWYEKAAAQNFAKAQYALGRMYSLDRGIPKDYHKAFVFFNQAAESNHRLAQFELGELYYNGLGIAQDVEKAIFWFKKSAAQNTIEAKLALAQAYHQD
ncbi:tetratricopeptide repeat protein [Bartonella sp. HY406]|uniref:tetratricopeptide repeat protein n=1 Tax=Bartonella sp. HY406 TaxID=2979331 RepID=UPI0021C85554|nr:tetratricopeptide repeat protein [Bartonella sp. HY406]UXN04929.1 sel1 repeat family protein [Bartonella sp. HY406]